MNEYDNYKSFIVLSVITLIFGTILVTTLTAAYQGYKRCEMIRTTEACR